MRFRRALIGAFVSATLLTGIAATTAEAAPAAPAAQSATIRPQAFLIGSILAPDRVDRLYAGDMISSSNGFIRLSMQYDGNLVAYSSSGNPLWSSGTYGRGGNVVILQGDGNFVMYDGNSRVVWTTNTNGYPGAWLSLQDDGNIVIYANDNSCGRWACARALWWTGTNTHIG
ncbi:hypothetical protein F0L68_04870 [Solihabitans fulvus]|uniref:Bulb-type lectin domain-containing protein n=1 Tax=Solihabitans fulvus TaxID=1892852 RepID=A0A5B2XR06_9PSEU|nr:hypothetical protein [Solihabitans fulvus]KAA2265400.1 hypothetical protein F0L68_04870 [Solihabitans fulvus]